MVILCFGFMFSFYLFGFFSIAALSLVSVKNVAEKEKKHCLVKVIVNPLKKIIGFSVLIHTAKFSVGV